MAGGFRIRYLPVNERISSKRFAGNEELLLFVKREMWICMGFLTFMCSPNTE